MNLKTIGQRYLTVFFFLGQSALNPCCKFAKIPSKRKILHFMEFIPSMLYFIYVILTCTFHMRMFSSEKFSFSYGVYSFFTLSKVLTCIMVLTCSPFFPNNLRKLWLQFEHMERYSSRVLQFTWSFKAFEQSYIRKVILIVVLLMARFLSKVALRRTSFPLYSLFSYSLVTTSIIATLHILFYVDLYVFMLRTINKNLSKSMKCRRTSGVYRIDGEKYEKYSMANIEMYKCLHYKLWKISYLINMSFGWILVSIFLQTMSNFLNPIYWIIIDFYEDDFTKDLQVISMPIFIYLFVFFLL